MDSDHFMLPVSPRDMYLIKAAAQLGGVTPHDFIKNATLGEAKEIERRQRGLLGSSNPNLRL